MRYASLAKDKSIQISMLGLSCNALPRDATTNAYDLAAISKLIQVATDEGINYIDFTSRPTDEGFEILLSEILTQQKLLDYFYLACAAPLTIFESNFNFELAVVQQLDRLKRASLDFYYLPFSSFNQFEVVHNNGNLERLQNFQRTGIVKAAGFYCPPSFKLFEVEEIVSRWDYWQFAIIPYNYFSAATTEFTAIMKFLHTQDIATIASHPLEGGLLAKLPFALKEFFGSYTYPRNPTEWALRFIWNQPEILCTTVSMNSPREIIENSSFALSSKAGALNEKETNIIAAAQNFYKNQRLKGKI